MRQKIEQINSGGTGSGLWAILLWSATFAVARSLSEQVGPLTAGAAVYLAGGAMLWLLRLGRSRPKQVLELPRKYLLGCGFLFILYTALIYLAVGLAVDREQLLEIALLNYLWPALTILFSLPLLNKRASPFLFVGTGLAVAGVFFVLTHGAGLSWPSFYQHWQSNPTAYSLALVAAVSWALYSNLTRRWSGAGTAGAIEFFIPATGLVLLLFSLRSTEPASWNWKTITEAGFLATITAMAYAFWEVAMRRGNLVLVTACSYFTPLLSTLVSCAYLKVMPGSKFWLGCMLLAVGSFITWRSVTDEPRSLEAVGEPALTPEDPGYGI